MNPSVVNVSIWALAATLVARLIDARQNFKWAPGSCHQRPDAACMIGQAALSSWLVARVGDASILIAVVQVAVASAFWQFINDSPESPLSAARRDCSHAASCLAW